MFKKHRLPLHHKSNKLTKNNYCLIYKLYDYVKKSSSISSKSG